MALVTAKFIAPLEVADLWGEFGAGIGLTNGAQGIRIPLRLRLGAIFNLYDGSPGLGFHAGYGAMTFILLFEPSVDLGIHFVKKF